MSQMSYEAAYPDIPILPRSRNWWAWLKGSAAECIHLEDQAEWVATLLPDTLYLRGKRVTQREPTRPEIALCKSCLIGAVSPELRQHAGRIIAFEPDPEIFTQYFYVGSLDFQHAGVAPDVASAIEKRLTQCLGTCIHCPQTASWLWLPRDQVSSLDEAEAIGTAPGEPMCAEHGTQKLCATFDNIPEASLFYVNLPYGEAGAYLWI